MINIPALIATVVVFISATIYAACGSDDRESRSDSECLSGRYSNSGSVSWNPSGEAWATNECPMRGKVVAKIDRRDASDWTWHLTDDTERHRSGNAHIRDIKCCSDLGICNKSDLTEDMCTDKFNSSPPSDCTRTSTTISPTYECLFEADCSYTTDSGTTETNTSSLYVLWGNADNIVNCNGSLKLENVCSD